MEADKTKAVLVVALCATFIAVMALSFGGYRLIAIGMASAFGGMEGSLVKSFEALLRIQPLHPLQAALTAPVLIQSGFAPLSPLARHILSPVQLALLAAPAPSAPSAWVLAVFAFLLMSVAADMYDQLRVEHARSSLAKALSGTEDVKVMEVAALGLNVRETPSADAPKAGLLGLGQRVGVLEMKDGWARLGEARWVNGVFLRPVGKVPVLSGVITRARHGTVEKVQIELTLSHHEKSVFGRYKIDAGAEWKPLAGTHGQYPLLLREEAGDRRRIATLGLTGDCLEALATKTVLTDGCSIEGEWRNVIDGSAWAISTAEPFRPLP